MTYNISKNYTNQNWIDLGLIDQNSNKWNSAIEIIKDRFESRFFKHINSIKHDKYSGFVVMSIDCLLIETLMQFYLGNESTDLSYPKANWKAFKDFFKNSNHFKTEFKADNICEVFYKQFRCGLLHQAQTKEKSRIKIKQNEFVKYADVTNLKSGLIIDREKFHSRLELEFSDYLEKLKNNESNFKGENLRINAIAKMNLICNE